MSLLKQNEHRKNEVGLIVKTVQWPKQMYESILEHFKIKESITDL